MVKREITLRFHHSSIVKDGIFSYEYRRSSSSVSNETSANESQVHTFIGTVGSGWIGSSKWESELDDEGDDGDRAIYGVVNSLLLH